jgi:2-polyprenyl-6-methoxyphenol hydroxylase-like FAD-dependent oxidoreductase
MERHRAAPLRVCIVGAGFAGGVLARLLEQQPEDFAVTLYEKVNPMKPCFDKIMPLMNHYCMSVV